MSNLNANISQFNTWARNGYYTSQWEFEADRAKLQSEIGAMNMRRDEINSKVDYFNSLTQRLNQISIESKQLTDSIDSRLTAPSDI
jgi:cell division protein FtsB